MTFLVLESNVRGLREATIMSVAESVNVTTRIKIRSVTFVLTLYFRDHRHLAGGM
jgi:hypothetical protein